MRRNSNMCSNAFDNITYSNKFPFFFCIKCSRIPLLKLIITKQIKLSIKCKCSNKRMKIEHYLYRIQQIHKELIKHSNHCESILSHYNDKAEGYCIKCKENLCMKCINQHKSNYSKKHSIILYQIIFDNASSNEIKDLYFCFDCYRTFFYLNKEDLASYLKDLR